MKKTVLTFGLLSGGILSALMLLTLPFAMEMDSDRGMIIGYTTMVLAFLMVFFGVRSYRDNVAGGTIRFGRALAVGALIALVSSACYVATWQVIYFGITPDYVERFQEHMMEQARPGGGSPEAVQARVAEMERFMVLYQNPAFNAAVTFLEPLPVGLVFALVTAGVLSRGRRREGAGLAAAHA